MNEKAIILLMSFVFICVIGYTAFVFIDSKKETKLSRPFVINNFVKEDSVINNDVITYENKVATPSNEITTKNNSEDDKVTETPKKDKYIIIDDQNNTSNINNIDINNNMEFKTVVIKEGETKTEGDLVIRNTITGNKTMSNGDSRLFSNIDVETPRKSKDTLYITFPNEVYGKTQEFEFDNYLIRVKDLNWEGELTLEVGRK